MARLPCISDYTNITCEGCKRKISKKEHNDVHEKIPKIPFKEWKFIEEPGISIINTNALNKFVFEQGKGE